jgi:hypothetical protein
VSYLYVEDSSRDQQKMRSYFDIVYRVGALISVIALLYTLQFSYSQRVHQEKGQITAELEQGMIDIQKLFLDPTWHDDLQLLYYEMHPNLSLPRVPDHPLTQPEYIVANVIFRRIETILHFLEITSNEKERRKEKYFRSWKSWFQSARLRKIWSESQHQYSQAMQDVMRRFT